MAWSAYILDLVAVAGFELGWAEVSQAACGRVPLYQPMYSVTARRALAWVGQGCRSTSSPVIEPKKLSARALSQHWRCASRRARRGNLRPARRTLQMCTGHPLSLWKITPGAGSRAATALPSASVTSPVRRLGSTQIVFDKKFLQAIVTRVGANDLSNMICTNAASFNGPV
jgi:hypothetical protein